MRNEFLSLYNMMAESEDVSNMHTFGNVHKEMMDWFIQNKPDLAQEWLGKLDSIRWNNFLTQQEAESIVSKMEPKAPWSREQWRNAMDEHGYETEDEPYYNSCSLWVTMDMIMSDSSDTIGKYVSTDRLFDFVYDLAVDKLTDEDSVFAVRKYFDV